MATTMKAHLADVHQRLSKHHAAVAGHYDALAKCMQKASNDEAVTDSQGILQALVDEHTAMSEFHATASDQCQKAADGDMNKIQPTNISIVTPNKPGIIAVPRSGQRAISETPAVDPRFAKLVESPDAEHNMTGWR